MDLKCLKCQEIAACELELDQRAYELTDRVVEFCRPVRDRNNVRWHVFAVLCALPFIGNLIFKIFNKPRGLEPAPRYYDEAWYHACRRTLYGAVDELEALKRWHLEHWGEEIVRVFDGEKDPPLPMKRSEAVSSHRGWIMPDKWDFHSAAGACKLRCDVLVMDMETKRVVPENECDWSAGQEGIFYYFRGPMAA